MAWFMSVLTGALSAVAGLLFLAGIIGVLTVLILHDTGKGVAK